MSTALSSKSQIVVPAEVRRKLGLKPGDEIIVEVEGDHAVLRKCCTSPLGNLQKLAAQDPELFAGFDEELQHMRDEWDK